VVHVKQTREILYIFDMILYDICMIYVRFPVCFELIYGDLQQSPLSLVIYDVLHETSVLRSFKFHGPYEHQMDPAFLPCHFTGIITI
jgi:hypothetical protein